MLLEHVKTKLESLIATLFIVFGLPAMIGCSSVPSKPYPDDALPNQEVVMLEQRTTLAKENQTDILSPNSFTEASKKLELAKKQLSQDSASDLILKPLAEARGYLDLAESNAQKMRWIAPEVLNARNDAIATDAAQFAPKSWERAEARLKREFGAQENLKEPRLPVRDRREMQNYYIVAQKDALKKKYLGQLREKIKKLDSDRGDQMIPKALHEARHKVAASEATIDANRKDMLTILASVSFAQDSVLHAQDLLSRAKTVNQGSTEVIANTLLKRDIQTGALTREKESAEYAIAQPSPERNISDIQKRFNPNEALVYTKGNNVLIRLKGNPIQNKAVLKEVRQLITESPKSTVLIESYSDQPGPTSKNLSISLQRATTIKEYLVRDPFIHPERIFSKGFGAEKPMPIDHSLKEKTSNSRIDITIQNIWGD